MITAIFLGCALIANSIKDASKWDLLVIILMALVTVGCLTDDIKDMNRKDGK